MGLLGGCVSSVWLIHDVKLAKQIQLGLQLLPGASGDVLETLNIDGNIDATFVRLAKRWTHLLEVITHAKYEAGSIRHAERHGGNSCPPSGRGNTEASANTLQVCDLTSQQFL